MATFNEWNPSTTDVNTAGNWSLGVIPTSAHVAVFNNGSIDCLGTATNAQWAGIIQRPGYKGTLGSSGSPLTVSAGLLELYGSTPVYFKDAGGVNATDVVVIACGNNAVPISLDGDNYAIVAGFRGLVTLKGTIGVIDLLRSGKVTPGGAASDVRWIVENGSNAITRLDADGGMIEADKVISAVNVGGGAYLSTDRGGNGEIGDIQQSGGLIRLGAAQPVGNKLGDIVVAGGTLDLGETDKIWDSLVVGPGARLIRNEAMHTHDTGGYTVDARDVVELAA